MAFFEQRFDERLSFGARGGPVWNTSVTRTQSGKRYTNKNWLFPLHRYDVSHSVKDAGDFEIVRAMFYCVAGQFDGFRFKDFSDYQLSYSNSRLLPATGSPGSPAGWQIYRVYTVGSREFLRPIYKPVNHPSFHIRRTRSGDPSNATFTMDWTAGVAYISGHVNGDTYTCHGEFDVPVAFAEDAMSAEIVDAGPDEYLLSWGSIVLEEIRL